MKREQYFNLTAILSNLSKELISDNIANRGISGDTETILYGLFDIIPEHKFLGDNPYYKTEDKKAYKQECNELVKHFLVTRYKKWFTGKYEREGNLILQFLFENKSQNEEIFIVPDTMISQYKSNKKNIKNNKIILADIFTFWLSNLIINERPEEYLGPKTIEVKATATATATAPKVTKRSYNAVDLDWDIDNDVDYNDSDRDRYIDDDGSNHAYNDRHDI
ncbi:hypothetical protein ACDZ29_25530 [Peribacillus sp. RS7]|uniref:hypothetical protein n=1 Tax=Peribacillus sp. RS7 TaxID=3242679 RepID=UPI0035BFC320